jgi:hypothetical protein
MPDDDDETMLTAEHVDHDDFHEGELEKGGGAADMAAGSIASSDGTFGGTGSVTSHEAVGVGAGSAESFTDQGGDAGGPATHEPAPPHTGSGDFPDPPPK